jgi:hypothetical protein
MLVAAIAEVLANSDRDEDDEKTARAILERLAQPDVRNGIQEAIHAAEMSARAAHAERDDLYADPRDSRVAAEIATTAVVHLLGESAAEGPDVDLETAQRIASAVTYRDWRFVAVPVTGRGIGIRVEATIADTHHPERTFTTTRFAEVTSTVEEACFRAALQVEHHEAQERFRVDGKAVFDSHAAGNTPAPTNLRQP